MNLWDWLRRKLCKEINYRERKYKVRIIIIVAIQLIATFTVKLGAQASVRLLLLPTGHSSLTEYILVIILDAFSILGMLLLNDVLGSGCRLVLEKFSAISTLLYSSTMAGVSTAYFIAYFIYISSIVNPPVRISLLMIVISAVIFAVSVVIPTLLQIIYVVLFSSREAYIIGGDLTTVAVGVLAMAMGMAFSTIQLPQINFSTTAGPLIGSGLTLIAVGLQRYYEGQGAKAKCTCKCTCS